MTYHRGFPTRRLPPTISFGEFDDPIECPESEQFDNGKEAGVRIYVRQGDNKVRVTFYFDHKCTDGVGAHVFCGDLLAFYTNAVEGKEVATLIENQPRSAKDSPATTTGLWWNLFGVTP